MSWSETFARVEVDDPGVIYALEPSNEATKREPSYEQFKTARAAAVTIIESGALGGTFLGSASPTVFNITMNGHANENHEPPPGWSPDAIFVSVSRATVPSEATKAANEPISYA